MSKALRYAAIIGSAAVIAFGGAQLIRPERTNPPIDARRTIVAHLGKSHPLISVLDRACSDCHSNGTRWSSYTEVAPLSWILAYAVKKGRSALNFSEWGSYPPEAQQGLLVVSCQDATSGKMPGSVYIFLHPEGRLTSQDIRTICSAQREAQR